MCRALIALIRQCCPRESAMFSIEDELPELSLPDGILSQGLSMPSELEEPFYETPAVMTSESICDEWESHEEVHLELSRTGTILYTFLYQLHALVQLADVNLFFARPVTEQIAPGYSKVIDEPMDFGTMHQRLTEYATLHDYLCDLSLVFYNAMIFNQSESILVQITIRLVDNVPCMVQEATTIKTPVDRRTTKKGNKKTSSKKKKRKIEKEKIIEEMEDEYDDDPWNVASEELSVSSRSDTENEPDEDGFSDGNFIETSKRRRSGRVKTPSKRDPNTRRSSRILD